MGAAKGGPRKKGEPKRSAGRRPPVAAARPRRPWAARVEQRTLASTAGDREQAAKAFHEGLSFAEQVALVRELVQTRAAELCRAYRDVVAVSHGFRRRRNPQTRKREVVREPCVTFVVRQKWRKGEGVSTHRVPDHLFAYWDVAGVRMLCAVGTDVEDARERAAIRPQQSPRRVVADAEVAEVLGVITCAIDRSVSGRRYAVSCQHVFSVTEALAPTRFWPATIGLEGGGTVATTENVRGTFTDAAAHSLDCQLALVTDRGQLRAALGGLRIDGHLTNSDQALALARCWIVTPDGPIEAFVNEVVGDEYGIDYDNAGVHDIRHEQLLLLHTTAPTKKGHSGSPVLVRQDGGALIGMHIGGNKRDLSVIIPAWHVLDPSRYRPRQAGDTWRLAPLS